MPGLDNTGPMGTGAQTGRRMGKCQENDSTVETENRLRKRMRMWRKGLGKRNQEELGRRNSGRGGRGLAE